MDTNKLRAQLRALEVQIDALYDASKAIESCRDALLEKRARLQAQQAILELRYGELESKLFTELRK